MVEVKGEGSDQQVLDVRGVEEDTWPHVDSQPGGPLHDRNLRNARAAAAKRAQQTVSKPVMDVATLTENATKQSDKIPEKFLPGKHLLHIFDEPLVGTVREGVLVGDTVLVATPNGKTFHVRGMYKTIFESAGPFTIESIKDNRVSDCAEGTRFYTRPYRASKPPKQ